MSISALGPEWPSLKHSMQYTSSSQSMQMIVPSSLHIPVVDVTLLCPSPIKHIAITYSTIPLFRLLRLPRMAWEGEHKRGYTWNQCLQSLVWHLVELL